MSRKPQEGGVIFLFPGGFARPMTSISQVLRPARTFAALYPLLSDF
jgi:hypothetical protein